MIKTQRFLATPDLEGYFDFFSNIIVINRYTENDVHDIKIALDWEPGKILNPRAISIRSLIIHEITHFLDMTTTAWGRQYVFRKLQLIKALINSEEEITEKQDVFMLETTEVDIHRNLLKTYNNIPPNKCNTLHHILRNNDQFGTFLVILYFYQNYPCHEVPLSMLSMLEANATASEYLAEFEYIDTKIDKIDHLLSTNEIERRFHVLLDDPQRLEYSVLLKLTQLHFSDLPLRELLALVSALCRFSLDADDMALAAMANTVERSSMNPLLGRSIAMELRRASHRHLIYFKSVLLMYGWMQEMREAQKNEYQKLLVSNPREAIESLWTQRMGIDSIFLSATKDFLPDEQFQWLREFDILKDAELLEHSYQSNARYLENSSAGKLLFKDLKLINIVLGDDTEVKMPNGFEFSVTDYYYKNMEIFIKLEAIYRNNAPHRFHIPLTEIKDQI